MFRFTFTAICTFFLLALIKFSINVPKLFSEESAYRFSPKDHYDLDILQINVVLSKFGLFQGHLIFAGFLMIVLGISLHYDKRKKKLKKIFYQVLVASSTAAGLLITSFSIWGA